jgi:D-alanyl-D-alanine carboxypeptidase
MQEARLRRGPVFGIPAFLIWNLAIFGLVFALLSPSSPSFAATPVSASIVVDAASGQVLSESNADLPTYPASLTKMMTLYLTFEALQKGKITFNSALPVSTYAASQPPTKLGLYPGETITIAQAIRGMIIKSANDAAVVVAEALGGSAEGFALKMNAKAQALGMNRTVFCNPNGLPNLAQHTTARDLLRLALALHRDFPQYYPLFAETRLVFRGHVTPTHNRFMLNYPGADGLKTGYISASGFNLAASASRNGRRIFGVVLGGRSPSLRDAQMWALFDQGFGTATPRGSSNALLLASASALPSLKPDDAQGDTDDDAADGSPSPVTNAMQAALPAPTPPVAPAASQPVASQLVAAAAPTVGYTLPGTAPMAPVIELQVLQTPAPAAAATKPATTKNQKLAGSQPAPALKPGAASGSAAAGSDQIAALTTGLGSWGIQVGAYNKYASARKAALRARSKLPAGSPQTRLAVDESRGGATGKLYRARLIGFAQAEAAEACRVLKARKLICMVVPSDMTVAETPQ